MKTFSEYLIDTKKKSYNTILEMQNYALSMAYSNANIVLEEYGIFKGCLQLSNFAANKIRKQLNKSNSSITNVEISYISFAQSRPNVLLERFFDTITIVCEITKNVHNLDGSYSFSSKFDTKECYIHNIIINLYIPVNDDYDDLESVLSHELTHAYNDYITKNGKIELGTVHNNELLYMDTPEIIALVENLFSYALIRDEYREICKRIRELDK